MATFITLVSFTDQCIKSVKESPKRAEALKAMAAKQDPGENASLSRFGEV